MRRLSVVGSFLCLYFNVSVVLAATNDEASNGIVTEVIETPITRTQAIQTQAKRWSLEPEEYEKYIELINGPLGKWNPDIDPLMALGMYSSSFSERRRYAELYAQQEFELIQRVLQFQQAYRAAFDLLYPNVGMLDQQLLAPYFEHELLQSASQQATRDARQLFVEGDRLLFFVPLACGRCLSSISHLMSLLSAVNNAGVDVYIRGAENDEQVAQWASEHNIQAQWLDGRSLTLNRDEGLFNRLESRTVIAGSTVLPIFLVRNEGYFQLKPEDLGL